MASTAFAFGSGTSATFASTTMPSVPSEPTISLVEIERRVAIDEGIEVVAADAAQHLGISRRDLVGMRRGELPHLAIAGAFERVGRAQRVDLARGAIAEVHDRCRPTAPPAVRARDRSSCRTSPTARRSSCWPSCRRWWRGWRSRCPGAKRRPCGRRAAFSSSSTMPGSTRAQRSADVQLEDLVAVLRCVDLQPFADRLAGLRRAAAAHRNGAAVPPADLHRANDIVS